MFNALASLLIYGLFALAGVSGDGLCSQKNRVGNFFATNPFCAPELAAQVPQPQLENQVVTEKTASGAREYRARYYDANLGRFTSEDPIGFGVGDTRLGVMGMRIGMKSRLDAGAFSKAFIQSLVFNRDGRIPYGIDAQGADFNLQRFVVNNPLSYVDPMGLAITDPDNPRYPRNEYFMILVQDVKAFRIITEFTVGNGVTLRVLSLVSGGSATWVNLTPSQAFAEAQQLITLISRGMF